MRRFPRSYWNILVVVAAAFALLVAPAMPASAEFIQQGPKLVGAGAIGEGFQGASVALSGDGNTALVGGFQDNDYVGAAWVFTRANGVWSQQGTKLIGSGTAGAALQGCSVALSADGKTALIGGCRDDNVKGAAWVFVMATQAISSHDFNGDGKSDILWRHFSSEP